MTNEASAQALVLTSLLDGVALPGTDQPILFPDLASYPDARLVVVSEADRWRDQDLPASVEIVPPGEAASLPPSDRPTLIFEFLEPEPHADRTGVRLRVSVSSGDGQPRPLGEVIAEFGAGDPPQAVDQPRVLAS